MASELLNYLYPGAITRVTRWMLIPGFPATEATVLDNNGNVISPAPLCDQDDSTAMAISYVSGTVSNYPLSFYITNNYEWSPKYLRIYYNLNTSTIGPMTVTLYKDSTTLATCSVTLTSGTHNLICKLTYTGTFSSVSGSYKLAFGKNVSTGQTLSIYSLELGEYRFSSLRQRINKVSAGKIYSRSTSQVLSCDMLAGSAVEEVSRKPFPFRFKRTDSALVPADIDKSISIFTVPSAHNTALYNNQTYNHYRAYGKTLTFKYVPAKNFFYNPGCGSTSLYPNLVSSAFTPDTPTNGSFIRGSSVFGFNKTSAVGAGDAVGYLSNNSTTDMHRLDELGISADIKLVLGVTANCLNITTGYLLIEEYYSGTWHTVISLEVTAQDPAKLRYTASGNLHLNTQSVSGVRMSLKILSAENSGVLSIDDVFLGVVG